MRARRHLAMVVALGMAGLVMGKVRGEALRAGPASVVSQEIDREDLARAVANGEAMLAHPKWKMVVPGSVSEMKVTDGMLICTEVWNPTIALNIENGQKLWESLWFSQDQPMEAADGGIEVLIRRLGDPGTIGMYRVAKETGKVAYAWNADIKRDPDSNALPTVVFAGKQVIAVGGFGVRRASQGKERGPWDLWVRAYDRKTGKEQWVTAMQDGAREVSPPVVVDGKVYVTVNLTLGTDEAGHAIKPRELLLALNAADGKQAWAIDMPQRISVPVVAGGLAIIARDTGDVVALDAKTGVEKWRRRISPDCDLLKSWVSEMEVASDMEMNGRKLGIDGDRVWVPVTQKTENHSAPKGEPAEAGGGPADGLAVFDVQTGRQVAYFNGMLQVAATGMPRFNINDGRLVATREPGKPWQTGWLGLTKVSPWAPEVYKDLIVARWGTGSAGQGAGAMGINRKTLRVEWMVAGTRWVLADGVMYANAAAEVSSIAKESELYALLIAGWEKVEGVKGSEGR